MDHYQSTSSDTPVEHQRPNPPDALDELLGLLADGRCRATVSCLRASEDDTATVAHLASELNARGHGPAEQAAVQLHHSILPRFADADVVEYDTENNTARYQGHDELETLLDGIMEPNPRTDTEF